MLAPRHIDDPILPKRNKLLMESAGKPRVLFINRSYWPDSEATGQLLTSLCEDLSSEFEIEVIAGRPNHSGEAKSASTVGFVRRRGVTIHRVLHTRFPKSSWLGRLTNLVTFTISAFVKSLWRSPRPDLIVTETDPFFLPLLGRFLKWRYQVPFVAYLQDIYPDIAVALGKADENSLTTALRSLLVSACNQADRVVVLSEDMRQRCIQNGVEESRLQIIPNWADCTQIIPRKDQNEFRKVHGLNDKFVVMYSGNMGLAHLLEPIVDAATELRDDNKIVFLFIGEGVQKSRLQELVEERGLTNVRFLSYQPAEFLEHSLSAADIHVVSMRPEVKGCVMPSKLYGILASGTAILSLAPEDSDVSRLVEQQNLGAVCDPAPAHTLTHRLAATIREMNLDRNAVSQQGQRGRLLCVEDYNRPLQVQRFANLLIQVLNPEAVTPSDRDLTKRSDVSVANKGPTQKSSAPLPTL